MIRIVGVDVATRLRAVGLAIGAVDPRTGEVQVVRALRGGTADLPGDATSLDGMVAAVAPTVAHALTDGGLLALDAPLGWPDPLRDGLSAHVAGAPLVAPPDRPHALWRRVTDEHAHAATGKLPLEVGADRIARAAHAALALLADVRERLADPLPMLLDPAPHGVAEVYPAGTLAALGAQATKYKDDPAARAALLDGPLARAGLRLAPAARDAALASDHAFDAAICVLAGADLALGRAAPIPRDARGVAMREGWIHVRARGPGGGG